MSRISSILGYSLFALMLIYFSVTWFVEDRIEQAINRISVWSDSIEGVSFSDIDFSLLSGDLEVEDLAIERMDPFQDVKADKATFGIGWRDRFRFLMEQDFSPLKLQGVEIELEGLRMIEQNIRAAEWTAGYARLELTGDMEQAIVAFLKQKQSRRGFKAAFEVERADIVPPPEVTRMLPVSGFLFPVQNMKVETVFDPGIYTLRSDIFIAKEDTSDNHLALTVVFDERKRENLVPKRAVLDIDSRANAHGRRFVLNDEGNELSLERITLNGTLEFAYAATPKPLWVPERARARIALSRPTLYPSTRFMRQYGAFFQTFGFENGFAQFDSVGGSLRFESGLFAVERARAYADWMEAEIALTSSLFENRGFDAPIQTGAVHITRLSAPLTAGVKFVERQTRKELFNKQGELHLPLAGTLNAPKIKGLF